MSSSAVASHRYFLTSDYTGDRGVMEMPPPPWQKGLLAEVRYPYDILEQALPLINARGLHFYFGKNAYEMPEYGDHVVSVLLQEERCKVPVYGRYIRATIRNLMSSPFLGYRLRVPMGRPEAVLTFEYARDWYTNLRSRWARAHPPAGWPAPVREKPLNLRIPLGYHSQEDVPYLPMRDRTLDTFFAGEVRPPDFQAAQPGWKTTSKFESRGQLWRALETLRSDGRWRLDFDAIAVIENQSKAAAFNTYSQKMMNSRICLAPRGTIADTFRHFEGLRAGCLVVSNPLPVEPYLHDAPMLVVDDWSELGGILEKYARNDDALQKMSDLGRAWWRERLTPQVIGQFIAEELNKS